MRSINPARILYEDAVLLAVNKLSGELVVRGKGELGKLPLFDFLRTSHPGIRPLHRLDFETSGAVVFAKTRAVLASVTDGRFAGWRKKYLALVAGIPAPKESFIRMALPARSGQGMVPAETRYRVKETFRGCCLLEAEIERGQHHQIRRHLASIGHPLLLDERYGEAKMNRAFSKRFHYRKFFLHAQSIDFPHPLRGKMLHIEAALPKAFEEVLGDLRKT